MRKLAALLACLALAACAAGSGPRDRYGRLLTPRAAPSEVIAVELAFARAAQEKGQWTAFREYATDDAVMFVPQAVNANAWLKGRDNPPQAVRWQPHQVWSSCDGSLAVTRGAWQRPDGSTGYFTTIWERQRNGKYRWVLDQGDTLTQPLAETDVIQAEVADCDAPVIVVQADGPKVQFDGMSDDKTLSWQMDVNDDLSRDLTVHLAKDGGMDQVVESIVSAPSQ